MRKIIDWIMAFLATKAFKSILKQIIAGRIDDVIDWFFNLGCNLSILGRKLAKKAGSEKLWNNTIEPVLIDGLDSFIKGLKSD